MNDKPDKKLSFFVTANNNIPENDVGVCRNIII